VRNEANAPLIRIIPALIHIQAHLDQDLSLDLFGRRSAALQVPLPPTLPKGNRRKREVLRGPTAPRTGCRSTSHSSGSCVGKSRWNAATGITRRSAGHFRAQFAMSPRDYRQHWSRRQNDKQSARSLRTTKRGAIRPALDTRHRAAGSYDRRIHSSVGGPTNKLPRTTSNA